LNVLITGGIGFIGSHTALKIYEAGYRPILLDNLSNSKPTVLKGLKTLLCNELVFIEGDIRDYDLLSKVFSDYKIDAVIHFGALKSVNDSVYKPFEYFSNNVCGTITLLNVMQRANVRSFIFSSSASVYGEKNSPPFKEDFSCIVNNPYARTKLHVEEMLKDLAHSENEWRIICLRYFNPVGAHSSGLIMDNPRYIAANLFPAILSVVKKEKPYLDVYGNDYATPDGSAIRDYIHIEDLAIGHLKALEYLSKDSGYNIINLGRGKGISVLEIIKAFEVATGAAIPFKFSPRREGDIAISYADVNKAKALLNWEAKLDEFVMCESAWRASLSLDT
jgi:UDP-glucose 4-epimerase